MASGKPTPEQLRADITAWAAESEQLTGRPVAVIEAPTPDLAGRIQEAVDGSGLTVRVRSS